MKKNTERGKENTRNYVKEKEGREGKNEKQIENAGIEERVWKIIKRQRRRGKINEKIKMGKYKKHFVRIMGEVEGKR